MHQPRIPERGTALANVVGRYSSADIGSLAKRLLNAPLSSEMPSELHELLMLLKSPAGICTLLPAHFPRNYAKQLGI
jgi:hypothetical protein